MKRKTANLWIRNTSPYPDSEVYILCRTALESVQASLSPTERLRPIIVKMTATHYGHRGRAHWTEREYNCGADRHTKIWYRILVRIGSPQHFPVQVNYRKFRDMPEFEFRTYREAIVGVTAHEIGHTLGNSGRKQGEEICEMCSWDAVDYYRKHQPEIDAEISTQTAQLQSALQARQNYDSITSTPQARREKKLQHASTGLARWQRKLKLATTKVKTYQRTVRRLQKTQQADLLPLDQPESQPMAQAATQSTP